MNSEKACLGSSLASYPVYPVDPCEIRMYTTEQYDYTAVRSQVQYRSFQRQYDVVAETEAPPGREHKAWLIRQNLR